MDSIKGVEQFLKQEIELYGDELALAQQHGDSEPKRVISDWQDSTDLNAFENAINTCILCPLGRQRTHFVFGNGDPNADILVVGDKPALQDDEEGLIFMGPDGKLLDRILAAIDLKRQSVYLCNLVKCRPEENRAPQKAEIDCCYPYLQKQIDLVDPAFILCLGQQAANTLLANEDSLQAMRGKVNTYRGRRVIVTHHPLALLNNTSLKRQAWQDVQLLQELYNQKTKKA